MIDRIKPKFLSSDQDERLGAEGMMTEALNVSISNYDEGDEGVIKNMKSNVEIEPATDEGVGNNSTVIGKVEDPSAGRVYFFVHSDTASESGIYYIDAASATSSSTTKYKKLLTSSLFNFTSDMFVKADIIKGTFLSSSSEETIIYFTDNVNPPRKVNVERASTGQYGVSGSDRFDRMISTIKGASNKAPVASLGSDPTRDVNNINDNLFQFATQIIYTDGEESAVSPYSGVVFGRPTYLNALEEAGFGVLPVVDNYIDIKHNVDLAVIPDIAKIRILCRASNNASWFVAEEYDPAVGVEAAIGTSEPAVLAAPNSGTYRFYADTLGSLVSPTVFNKPYDNVPLKAKGQSIVRDRLMYSNYTEGFANVDCTGAILTAKYDDENSTFGELILSTEVDGMFSFSNSNKSIDIDFSNPNAFQNDTTPVAGGTRATISFDWRPTGSVTDGGSDILTCDFFNLDFFSVHVANFSTITLANGGGHGPAQVSVQATRSNDGTVEDLIGDIAEQFLNTSANVLYTCDGATCEITTTSGTVVDASGDIGGGRAFDVTWKFDDYSISGTTLTLKPYISEVSVVQTSDDSTDAVSNSEFLVDSDEQSDLTYTINANPADEFGATATSLNLNPTLKSGSSHSFGLVYYDKFGRHGFVNPIGSVDIDYPSKRSGSNNQGAASAFIELAGKTTGNHISLPSWADSWQVVLSEPNTIFDSFQYTVGGAFVPVKDNGHVDTKIQKVYVSLKTLQKYKDEKGVLRDYSFTEGDKLRVISHRPSNDSGDTVHPTSNADSNFGNGGNHENNPIIEFDVVGYEVLSGNDAASNPLMGVDVTYTNAEKKKYDGAFVVLESSPINTGVEIDVTTGAGADGGEHPLMYKGFDWQSVAYKQAELNSGESTSVYYNDIDVTELTSSDNKWTYQCLVDIVSPRKRTSEQIYYEIGVGGVCYTNFAQGSTAGNNHGVFGVTVNQSNYYMRPVACKTPVYDSGWNYDSPDDWEYKTLYIEDKSVTDRIVSNSWNRGKAHVIYEKAKEVRRPYSVTWSDRYNVDVETLTLSSFNAAQVNYANYAAKYGGITYIENYDENLLALQENKASVVGISKAVLNQAGGGDGVVSLSTSVLDESSINYYAGDWGCNLNPESVLIYDTQVFFADASRGKVIRITREGLSAISDKGLSRLLDGKFQNVSYSSTTKKVLSGFDPDDQYYYVTIKSDSATNTYAYDVRSGVWVSEASFIPDMYAHLDNEMYTFKYVSSGNKLVWRHSKTNTRNQFYGTNYDSKITVYSKFDPSMVKIYKAVGLNYQRINNLGSLPDIRLVSSEGNDTGDGVMAGSSLQEREGQWYREVPGDTSGSDAQHYFGIGNGVSASGTTLTMSNLRNARVPIGGHIYYMDGNDLEGAQASGPLVTVSSVDYSTNTITASGALNSAISNADIIIVTDESANGARIRGRYCKVTLDMSTITPWELYSIDMNFENSRPNYALGQ